MNNTEAQDYLRDALIRAGMQADRVLIGMELARDTTHRTAPSASVYAVETVVRREKRMRRITAEQLDPPVDGALSGVRRGLAAGVTTYEVTLAERGPADMQNLLSRLLTHLVTVPLVDRSGERHPVLPPEGELKVGWNDHDEMGQVVVTFRVDMPFVLWQDHPVIPINIVVQYRLEGGNEHE